MIDQPMTIALLIPTAIVGYITLTYIFRSYRDFGKVTTRWYIPFKNTSFSAQEFYNLVEMSLIAKGIYLDVARVKYRQKGMFSAYRDYLRVTRGNYMFLMCAASFGTEFFVSWWGGQRIPFHKDLIGRLPLLGPVIILIWNRRTFYEMDTEAMIEGIVRGCFMEAIDSVTSSKGLRALSDTEKQPIRGIKWK